MSWKKKKENTKKSREKLKQNVKICYESILPTCRTCRFYSFIDSTFLTCYV